MKPAPDLRRRHLRHVVEDELPTHSRRTLGGSTAAAGACRDRQLDPDLIAESGVDAALVNRLSDVWVGLPAIAEPANDLPELLPALLTLLCEHSNVPHRNMAPDALNVLRQKNWSGADGGWSSLLGALKNLALNALDETISRQDVDALLLSVSEPVLQKPVEEPDGSLMQFYEMPLKEARDARNVFTSRIISRAAVAI